MLVERDESGCLSPSGLLDKGLKLPDELTESKDSGLDTSGSVTGSCICSKQDNRYDKLKEELAFKEVMIAALQESNQCLRLRVAAAENKAAELRLICEKHCSCCARTFWPNDTDDKLKKWEDNFDDQLKPCFTSTPSKEITETKETWKKISIEEKVAIGEWTNSGSGEECSSTSKSDETLNGRSSSSAEDWPNLPDVGVRSEGWRLGVEHGWRRTQDVEWKEKSRQWTHHATDWRFVRGEAREEAVDVRKLRSEEWEDSRLSGVTHFSLLGDQGISVSLSPHRSRGEEEEVVEEGGSYKGRSKLSRFLNSSTWRMVPEEGPLSRRAPQAFSPWADPSPTKLNQEGSWRRTPGAESHRGSTTSAPTAPSGRPPGWKKLYQCLDEADAYANKLALGLSKIPPRRP